MKDFAPTTFFTEPGAIGVHGDLQSFISLQDAICSKFILGRHSLPRTEPLCDLGSLLTFNVYIHQLDLAYPWQVCQKEYLEGDTFSMQYI